MTSLEPPADLPQAELLLNESDQRDEETALSAIFPNEFRRLEQNFVYSVDSPNPEAGSQMLDEETGEDVPLLERYTSSRLECAYEFQLMVYPDILPSQEIRICPSPRSMCQAAKLFNPPFCRCAVHVHRVDDVGVPSDSLHIKLPLYIAFFTTLCRRFGHRIHGPTENLLFEQPHH